MEHIKNELKKLDDFLESCRTYNTKITPAMVFHKLKPLKDAINLPREQITAYQVINENGADASVCASEDLNSLAIFETEKEANAYLVYLRDKVHISIAGYAVIDVKILHGRKP